MIRISMWAWFLCAGTLAVCGLSIQAADEPKSELMLGTLTKTEQAGFGGLCGMCVERTTGDVLINK